MKNKTPFNQGFISVPGGKVYYETYGNSDKTPLLVLHGGPGYPHYSLLSLTTLSNTKPVIFYDQLGCGKSDRADDKKLWQLNRFVEELATVKKALKLNSFHLFGHSWGSMLATNYFLKYPQGIKSLILSGPFLSEPRWIADTNKLKATLPKKWQQIIEQHESNRTTDSKKYKQAISEFSKRYFCRVYPPPKILKENRQTGNPEIYNIMWGPSEFYCIGNLKGVDLILQLHKINIPVLFMCGRFDTATPQTTKYYQSLVPNSEMVVLEKSAHVPYLEEPDLYLKTIQDFLNKSD